MESNILRSTFMKFASSVLRTLLASLFTWLMARKYLNAEIADQLMALAGAIVPILVWSFIERYIIEKLHLSRLMTALQLPENSTLKDLQRATKVTKELPDVDTNTR